MSHPKSANQKTVGLMPGICQSRQGAKTAEVEPVPISELVRRLEEKARGFENLCGEIMATIHVNRERGQLRCTDGEAEKHFEEIVEGWRKRRKRLEAMTTEGSIMCGFII